MSEITIFAPAGLSAEQLAVAIAENHAVQMVAENRALVLAAQWADVHTEPADDGAMPVDRFAPLVERWSIFGGEGTPPVAEWCCAEYGQFVGVGMVAGRAIIADALDLRHRLPLTWRRVCAGQVRAWKARKIAEATRELDRAAAGFVDRAICGFIETLPWPRFEQTLGAAVREADPDLAAVRAAAAKVRRGVWATRSEDGLRTLVAKAASGDVVVFMATVNRIADILGLEAEATGRAVEPIGQRRAAAIGILAQPAKALALLLAHAADPDPGPTATDPEVRDEFERAAGPRTSLLEADEPEPPTPKPPPDPPDETLAPDLLAEPPDAPEVDAPEPDEPEDVRDRAAGGLWLPDFDPTLLAALIRRLRPVVSLSYHLSDAAIHAGHGEVRSEHDHADPTSLRALREWMTATGCPITVRPVLDPADVPAIDRYEIPHRMRTALALRNPVDVFPYAGWSRRVDIDHTRPYAVGGPPGQTGLHNLGPLARRHHRIATFSGWRKRQPNPGTYVWRSPRGWVSVVTNQGTLDLGPGPYAQAVWRAAAPDGTRSHSSP